MEVSTQHKTTTFTDLPESAWMGLSFRLTPRNKTLAQRFTVRELGGLFSTAILICGVCTVFLYFIAHKLTQKTWETHAVFGITIGLAALSLTFLFLTYITDPGVVPHATELDIERMANLKAGERICYTCKIIRPKRAKHCKWCNHCVEVFDHHCPYVGTCIGAGNYILFVGLMLSGTLAAGWVCGCSVYYAANNSEDPATSPSSLVAVVLGAMGGLIVLATGHLCCYHALIAITGETTNERILAKRAQGGGTSVASCRPVSKAKKGLLGADSPAREPLISKAPSSPLRRQFADGVRKGEFQFITEGQRDSRPSLRETSATATLNQTSMNYREEKLTGGAGAPSSSSGRDRGNSADTEKSVVFPLNGDGQLILPGKQINSTKRTGSYSNLSEASRRPSLTTNPKASPTEASRFTDL